LMDITSTVMSSASVVGNLSETGRLDTWIGFPVLVKELEKNDGLTR
jgi:hypothetical protein